MAGEFIEGVTYSERYRRAAHLAIALGGGEIVPVDMLGKPQSSEPSKPDNIKPPKPPRRPNAKVARVAFGHGF